MFSLSFLFLSTLAILLTPAPLAAQGRSGAPEAESSTGDWYFREEVRWERYVLFLRTASEVRQVNELWIGDDRAAYLEPGQRVVLDHSRNTFTYLNTRERTYVELQLPLDESRLFSPEMEHKRRALLYGATVDATGRKDAIAGFECDEYEVTVWEERDGARDSYRSIHVWATTEHPADHALAEQLFDLFRRLQPRTGGAVDELRKIHGIQLRIDYEGPGNFVVRERLLAEDVEIARRTPAAGVYDVPPGYTRKPWLTPEDL